MSLCAVSEDVHCCIIMMFRVLSNLIRPCDHVFIRVSLGLLDSIKLPAISCLVLAIDVDKTRSNAMESSLAAIAKQSVYPATSILELRLVLEDLIERDELLMSRNLLAMSRRSKLSITAAVDLCIYIRLVHHTRRPRRMSATSKTRRMSIPRTLVQVVKALDQDPQLLPSPVRYSLIS